MKKKYVLGIDQGTTGTKAVIFDEQIQQISLGYREIPRTYPKPGWVEQNPRTIWLETIGAVKEALHKARISVTEIASIGIADQGETIVVWNRSNGRPVHNAIVWQCRRTSNMCEELKKDRDLDKAIVNKTGLRIDPYFSATKIKWILENVPNVKKEAERGNVLFGTTDSWLIWNLTKGKNHVTDYATASRTMMLNIHSLQWDKELLDWLNIPATLLPDLRSNCGVVAETNPNAFFDAVVPISGVVVDQQGALFGQCCYTPGMAKNTYGTGCFALMNVGKKALFSKHGLLTTIAWVLNGETEYALDGGVYVAGAAVQWLRDGLRIIDDARETDRIAKITPDTAGVYFVPAFVGLAAPHWDTYAAGTIIGITEGTNRNHIVRATLEAIAYQTYDVLESMEADSKLKIDVLRVDGGPVKNSFLMQFQSDILGVPIEVPKITEATALGAASLAGLGIGLWRNQKEIKERRKIGKVYRPRMNEHKRQELIHRWKKAVRRTLRWNDPHEGSYDADPIVSKD